MSMNAGISHVQLGVGVSKHYVGGGGETAKHAAGDWSHGQFGAKDDRGYIVGGGGGGGGEANGAGALVDKVVAMHLMLVRRA
jgi:hypothetical protein